MTDESTGSDTRTGADTGPSAGPRMRLLYDADCGFCTRSAQWLAAHGEHLAVEPMQSLDLPALGIDPARAVHEVPLRHPDGRVSWGSAAMADALTGCRPPWPVAGRIMQTPPVAALARPVYALVARYRHRLPGGSAACRLPPR